MDRTLLHTIQNHVARVAISPSAMRGPGSAGSVEAARSYLAKLNLGDFGVSSGQVFQSRLGSATDGLLAALPAPSRHWGLARKALNIFLRDCLYNRYLCEAYQLEQVEPLLELPLDSITGSALVKEAHGSLPSWKTIRGLRPDTSATFQAVASEVAERKGIARVHLDAILWGGFNSEQ